MNHVGGQTLVNGAGNVITVWSDIGCPWATLALHTLRNQIRTTRVDVLIDHRTFAVTTLPVLEAVQAAKHPRAGGLRASDELDEALRRAFWVDHECVSVLPIVYRVAASCEGVDLDGLRWAMATGHGRQAILEQWPVAQSQDVVCGPHLFAARGVSSSNPGARYTWTSGPGAGFPRLVSYDPQRAGDPR
ncbi:dithiol-disulfide isomerase [Nocardioides hungaricus]